MLTNCPKYFQNTIVIKTGLSDFHKIIVTIMKTNFRKLNLNLYTTEITRILEINFSDKIWLVSFHLLKPIQKIKVLISFSKCVDW